MALDLLELAVPEIKGVLSFVCTAKEAFFSIIDEDLSQCLTGLDSMLEE